MQENIEPVVQNEPFNNQVSSPMPPPTTSVVRENAFKYPAEQKAPVQFNMVVHKASPVVIILLIIIFLLGLGIVLWKFVFAENIEFLSRFRATPSPIPTTVIAMPTATPIATQSACVKEGENGSYFNHQECCLGLKKLAQVKYAADSDTCATSQNDNFVCGNCGNGICGAGESKCNCPTDCK